MKVFLQLLKMRILSVFKGSGKKDKYKKNIGFKVFIGIVVAYAALCFVGMFGFYFMQLAENFVEQEVGFAYFSMVAVVMVAIGFVTTVFAAQSQIFEAKDNDLLTAMPIPPRYILLTRVITLLIVELAESLVLGIEAMLIYKIFAPAPVGGAIMMVVEIIGLNMITASIWTCSCGNYQQDEKKKYCKNHSYNRNVGTVFFPDKRNGKQNQQYAQYGRRFYRDG